MISGVTFEPMLPGPLLAALCGISLALVAIAAIRGGRGWALRGLAILALAAAVANPRVIHEQRQARPDLAVIVVDDSPSQRVGGRRGQSEQALASAQAMLNPLTDLETRVIRAGGDEGEKDSRLFDALDRALANERKNRVAGAVLITDGQVHDAPTAGPPPPLAAPLHVLLTGTPNEQDRQIVVEQAPAYGLVGTSFKVSYRVEDAGVSSQGQPPRAVVRFRLNGTPAGTSEVVVGRSEAHAFTLDRAGPTVLELDVDERPGEISTLNNRAAVVVNGVRDRLRVLLVSGQPHPGERTWRNLLKSDPAVDLVHFTILRPPEKDDVTPLKELSLIVFPVEELFESKLYDFDLIIFDRYTVYGILPPAYLKRVVDYVRQGGAILLAAGPEFAGPRSLYLTPLGETMPGAPTGQVVEQEFRASVTELGRRHPVTSDLQGASVGGPASGSKEAGDPMWGRWFRLIEAEVRDGDVLMSGPGGRPLLVVKRIGDGRIAQLMSDQMWLWARGFDGGGPQAELLRRLAHWLMKEPELEEENLTASVDDGRLIIARRSLAVEEVEARITHPSGKTETITLKADAHGVARAERPASEIGLYRVEDGKRQALAVSGAVNPPELVDLRATADRLAPVAKETGGGIAWLTEGVPEFRRVSAGGDAAGRGWMGLKRNRAYDVTGSTEVSLLPGLFVLALALGGLAAAWWREGR